MTGPPPPPAPPRSPWQLFYGAAHRVRRAWWARRAARLSRAVVSVGNLHWGGTGKTPLVAAVARHLRDSGLAVAILSRGYRGSGRGVRLVSTGEGPLLGPRVAGDEPVLLAGKLPGVAVVVGPDRYLAGQHALERLDPPPDVFVLDDGFSHLRLERDIDLLAFPAADPFAGGRLAPGGRLREPLASAAFADAAILTGSETGTAGWLAESLRPFGFRGPSFASRSEIGEILDDRGNPAPPGDRCLLVTGIARPERVDETVSGLPFEIAGRLRFPDHHDYGPDSLERIRQAWRESGAELLLTTEKDQIKLRGTIDLPTAAIPFEARPEDAFWEWLDGRLAELGAGAA